MSIITDLIPPQFKVAAEAVAFVVIIGLFGVTYLVGHMKGTSACEIKNANAAVATVVKGNNDHATVEKRVLSLPDKRLNRALLQFVYD